MITIEQILAESARKQERREAKPIRTAIADTASVIGELATVLKYGIGIINANLEVEYYSAKIEGLKELQELLKAK